MILSKTNRVEKGQQHPTVKDEKYLHKRYGIDQKLVLKGSRHELFDFFLHNPSLYG
jgi:hypothetical protein